MAWYWAAWLLLGFGVPEGIALGTGHGEWTLSETAWNWFDVLPGQTPRQWSIVHFILCIFMTWLWVHMVVRAWTVWRIHRT
jgi:hypothetical protein